MSQSFFGFPLAILLSVSVLFTLIALIILCTCWNKHENSIVKHVYVLDENNGFKKVAVRRLGTYKKNRKAFKLITSTNIDVLKDDRMSNDRLPRREIEGRYYRFSDATDAKTKYNDCKIEIILDENPRDDEMMSCNSNDSKNTFYSTYPLLRTLSTSETFRSVTGSDEDLV